MQFNKNIIVTTNQYC